MLGRGVGIGSPGHLAVGLKVLCEQSWPHGGGLCAGDSAAVPGAMKPVASLAQGQSPGVTADAGAGRLTLAGPLRDLQVLGAQQGWVSSEAWLPPHPSPSSHLSHF